MTSRFIINHTYHTLLKPLLFQFDPEFIHDSFTSIGQTLGRHQFSRAVTRQLLNFTHPALNQSVAGLNFTNPIGLSAGFDYDAKMSGIIPSVGFAFESVGTVTRHSYNGNPKPRLARLPKSQSLLVNKGFKSEGIQSVLDHFIQKPDPSFNLGISVGATNSPQTSTPETQIADILASFKLAISHPQYRLIDYLELNISCPNVLGSGSLADEAHLEKILSQLDRLNLKKPLFIKFPIHCTDAEALALVSVMIRHHVAAVVIGNLYKKRDPQSFDPNELNQVKKLPGNFSGKPTEKLSNHLISLIHQHFKNKIVIIGVGGIFTAEDAYTKIKLGASLVQLITGMIYEGPGLIGSLNRGLVKLLNTDGHTKLSEAIGKYTQTYPIKAAFY